MDKLIKKLLIGKHTVLFEPQTASLCEVQERLKQGFVFIKFIETEGGTELGVKLDNPLTSLEGADFKTGKGILKIMGTCELNFQKIRCIAEINLTTRQGKGYLELLNNNLNP